MTPFQQFRLWTRQGALSERVIGATGVVLAVALLAWAAVSPGGSTEHDVSALGGPTVTVSATTATTSAGGAAAPAAGGATLAPTAGSSSAGGTVAPGSQGSAASGPAATAAGSSACPSPPGSVSGITATQMKIAIVLTEIGGAAANSAFGIPTAAEQRALFESVIENINAQGGVACRKLTATYYTANPIDQAQLTQICRDIADSGAFAALDFTAYRGDGTCFAQRKIPFFSGTMVSKASANRLYPYLFGPSTSEDTYHNAVVGLRERGFFKPENGFKKLGLVYRSCDSELVSRFNGWLRDAGVAAGDVVPYDVGCPSAFASPTDIGQAVLKFQRSGVTHATAISFNGDMGNFTKVAERQGFRPLWGLGDDGTIAITYTSQGADPANIANAISIVSGRWAEERTPGVTPSPPSARCNAIYAAHKQPPVYDGVGSGGNVCAVLWMLQAAVEHAPSLQQTSLGAGIRAAKSVDLPFPFGPNDFSGERVTAGGQFWRAAQFFPACTCWRIIEPNFHRGPGS